MSIYPKNGKVYYHSFFLRGFYWNQAAEKAEMKIE